MAKKSFTFHKIFPLSVGIFRLNAFRPLEVSPELKLWPRFIGNPRKNPIDNRPDLRTAMEFMPRMKKVGDNPLDGICPLHILSILAGIGYLPKVYEISPIVEINFMHKMGIDYNRRIIHWLSP
jgi:hypothetical protein